MSEWIQSASKHSNRDAAEIILNFHRMCSKNLQRYLMCFLAIFGKILNWFRHLIVNFFGVLFGAMFLAFFALWWWQRSEANILPFWKVMEDGGRLYNYFGTDYKSNLMLCKTVQILYLRIFDKLRSFTFLGRIIQHLLCKTVQISSRHIAEFSAKI